MLIKSESVLMKRFGGLDYISSQNRPRTAQCSITPMNDTVGD